MLESYKARKLGGWEAGRLEKDEVEKVGSCEGERRDEPIAAFGRPGWEAEITRTE